MRRTLRFCLAAVSLAAVGTLTGMPPSSQAQSPAPPQSPSRTTARIDDALPHDSHNGVVVSVKPLTDQTLAKQTFGKANPLPLGILPVEVFLRNDTDQPIRLDLSTVQLSVRTRGGHTQDIEWRSVQEVASAVAHPNGPPAPHQSRFPTIGVPTGGDSKTDKLAAILQPLAFDADVLPPQSALHGFLFFDLNHDLSLAEDASLYVPDLSTIPANKPLMFFEVPLAGAAKP